MMKELILYGLLILIRFVSGFKNNAYYVRDYTLAYMLCGTLTATVICLAWELHTWRCVFFLFPFFGLIGFSTQVIAKKEAGHSRIHFWEHMVIDSVWIIAFIAGCDIYTLLLSIYPGLVLFNIPIRYGAENKLIVSDEHRPKELVEWSWGHINVPRINNGWIRLYIGVACMILYAAILYTVKNWGIPMITIEDIFKLFS